MKNLLSLNFDFNEKRIVLISLAVSILYVLLPILIFSIPPVGDFPNNLARYWIVSGANGAETVGHIYQPDWSRASTNIGLDLLAATIGRVMPLSWFGKLVLIITFIGPPVAAICLNRILFQKWSWWQIIFMFLAWTTTSLSGFLGFQASVTAALIAVCLERYIRPRPVVAFFAHLVLGYVVAIFHPIGFGFYGVLLFGLYFGAEIPSGDNLTERLRSVGRRGLTALMGTAPFMMAVSAIILLSSTAAPNMEMKTHLVANTAGRVHYSIIQRIYSRISQIVEALFSPLLTYNIVMDLFFIAAFSVAITWVVSKARVSLHFGLLMVGVGLFISSPFTPSTIGESAFVNIRAPMMGILVILISLSPVFKRKSINKIAIFAMFLLVFTRSSVIAMVWRDRDRDVVQFRKVIAHIPENKRVLIVLNQKASAKPAIGRYLEGMGHAPSLRHLGGLVVIERRSFIPTLFANRGQQPLRVLPPWNALSEPIGTFPSLKALEEMPPGTQRPSGKEAYLANWRENFDYVLVIYANEEDVRGGAYARSLELVADERFSRLYSIAK